MSYGCGDLVVIGRVQNLRHIHVDIPDDIIGRGWNLAHIAVRKLLKGRAPGRVLSVQYFAHTYLRTDRDFLFVLAPAGGDVYEVKDARLRDESGFPRVSDACGRTSD